MYSIISYDIPQSFSLDINHQIFSPDFWEGACFALFCLLLRASLVAQLVKNACNSGDPGLIPGSGRSAGKGNGYPLKYSGLENSADCIVHGVEGGCFALICLLLKSN